MKSSQLQQPCPATEELLEESLEESPEELEPPEESVGAAEPLESPEGVLFWQSSAS